MAPAVGFGSTTGQVHHGFAMEDKTDRRQTLAV
jgi:hypothetical protein